jgi:hypothetical protein
LIGRNVDAGAQFLLSASCTIRAGPARKDAAFSAVPAQPKSIAVAKDIAALEGARGLCENGAAIRRPRSEPGFRAGGPSS